MLLDPTDNKPTRVGVRSGPDGQRERYAKRTGNAIEWMEATPQKPSARPRLRGCASVSRARSSSV